MKRVFFVLSFFLFFLVFLIIPSHKTYACVSDNTRGCYTSSDCCNSGSSCVDQIPGYPGICAANTGGGSWGNWGNAPEGTTLYDFSKLLGSGRPNNASKATWQNVLSTTISLLMLAAVIVALAYLILGGFNWILSGGDKQRLAKARDHVVYAIIGLVVIFVSFFIIQLVGAFFSINFLNLP